MKKVNSHHLPQESWTSPKGKFGNIHCGLSEALGHDPNSPEFKNRHPFDVEINRVPPGKSNYPYHVHSAQWEFYHVISGTGLVRDESGKTAVVPGDAFMFPPGEAHQVTNNGEEDLVYYVIADNPVGESAFYPDSQKWLVKTPERRLIRSESLEYLDGEE